MMLYLCLDCSHTAPGVDAQGGCVYCGGPVVYKGAGLPLTQPLDSPPSPKVAYDPGPAPTETEGGNDGTAQAD